MTTTQTSFAGGVTLLSSTLDNATATQLGLFQYLGGSTYNSVTITVSSANFTVTRATFLPYQTQTGSWRLRFNIGGSYSVAVTTGTITITGIVWQLSVAQAVTAIGGSQAYCYASQNTNNLIWGSSSSTGVNLAGDCELNAKPTWAY